MRFPHALKNRVQKSISRMHISERKVAGEASMQVGNKLMRHFMQVSGKT